MPETSTYTTSQPPRCNHLRQELRRRRLSNGVIVVCRQCLTCGHNGGNVKKSETDESKLPWWDAALVERWQERMSAYWQERRDAFDRERVEKNREWWDRYNRHLASPAWESLRQRVLKRCGGLCEGCGERRAVHVHHATYEHMGDEFLFELLGLCRQCHERLHGRTIGYETWMDGLEEFGG